MEEVKVEEGTAYTWSGGDLILADQNRVRGIDSKGIVSQIAEITGKVLEPKIWNGTEMPSVTGLAVKQNGDVIAAVPHLGKVYSIGKDGRAQDVTCNEGNWRATGVSVFDQSIFLMEVIPTRQRA